MKGYGSGFRHPFPEQSNLFTTLLEVRASIVERSSLSAKARPRELVDVCVSNGRSGGLMTSATLLAGSGGPCA